MNDPSSDGLQTTQTSLEILEYVQNSGGATLADVVQDRDLAKSTAHHHLSTLLNAGYFDKEGETYHLGIKLFNLGEEARQRLGPVEAFERSIGGLADETLEEAVLVVENGGKILTTHSVTHDRTNRSDRRIGRYHYMHDSAVGKAILAKYSEDRVKAIVDRWGLPATTEHTITDYEDLRAELRRTQERGYALSDQEWLEGLFGIGEAIHRPAGEVYGALGVSGPTYRFRNEEALDQLVDALERSVAETEAILASRLGE